jgi:hypothetical protein
VDGSLNDPTPTGEIAERVDVYRIALVELRRAGHTHPEPDDILNVARFLEYGADYA